MTTLVPAESRSSRNTAWLLACLAILVLQMAVQYWMGRTLICECGYVKLFEPVANGPGNSQHLADWYTPSHIIHGFLFYGLAHLVLRRKSLAAKLLLALVIESGWELLENSPIIIDRYRAATIALGYSGDSILNSMSDIGMMALGFMIAARLPVAMTICLGLALEVIALVAIRDNLTLNVLMLAWPIEAIKSWQSAL